jgi:hypothetical protein
LNNLNNLKIEDNMSKKNIYYVSTLLLTSSIFGCKNNQIAEKVDDVIFFETSQITCNKASPENICDMEFDYKQEKIGLKFASHKNTWDERIAFFRYLSTRDPKMADTGLWGSFADLLEKVTYDDTHV